MKKILTLSLTLLALGGLSLATASVASARGSTAVRATGSCTGASTSKLKLSRDNGRIEVDFEVDQNRNGVLWNVRLWDNDVRVFAGTARTQPPSGSFEVRRLIADRAGADHIVAKARNPASDEVCRAAATI